MSRPPVEPPSRRYTGDDFAPTETEPWWCSWPVIIVAELIFVVPAVVLVWQRRFTSTRTK